MADEQRWEVVRIIEGERVVVRRAQELTRATIGAAGSTAPDAGRVAVAISVEEEALAMRILGASSEPWTGRLDLRGPIRLEEVRSDGLIPRDLGIAPGDWVPLLDGDHLSWPRQVTRVDAAGTWVATQAR